MISGALPISPGCAGPRRGLLDENVEEIDWEELAHYDIVGVTGMNVQKNRTREILVKLREMKIFTVVGGPFVSVKEDFFDGLCDVKFVGEAETPGRNFSDASPRAKLPKRATSKRSPPT